MISNISATFLERDNEEDCDSQLECPSLRDSSTVSCESRKGGETSFGSMSSSAHYEVVPSTANLVNPSVDLDVCSVDGNFVISNINNDLKKCIHSSTTHKDCSSQENYTCSCLQLVCKTCLKTFIQYSSKAKASCHSEDIGSSSGEFFGGESLSAVGAIPSADVHCPLKDSIDEQTVPCKAIPSYTERVVDAMEFVVNSRELYEVPDVEIKLKNIMRSLQQILQTSVYCDKATQTCQTDFSSCDIEEVRSYSAEKGSHSIDYKAKSSAENINEAVKETANHFDNDTEFICGKCDDIIVMFNNDIKLSLQRHCQEARHLLSVGTQPSGDSSCSNSGPKSTPPTDSSFRGCPNGNEYLPCDKIMHELRSQLSLEGQSDFVQIYVNKMYFQFLCTLCNVKALDLDSFNVHLKGGPHKAKLKKTTAQKKSPDRIKALSSNTFLCTFCQERFKEQVSLITHLKIHETKKMCKVCKKSFSTEEALLQHSKALHHVQRNIDSQDAEAPLMGGSALVDGDLRHQFQRNDTMLPQSSLEESSNSQVMFDSKQGESLKLPLNRFKLEKSHETECNTDTESKWIKVTGKAPFSLDFIFNTFSTVGVITKIITFLTKNEARIQFREVFVAKCISQSWKSHNFGNKIVDVSTLNDVECKKFQGAVYKADLNLPFDAQSIVITEQIFLHTCSGLMKEAQHVERDLEKVDYLCDLLERLLKQHFPKCRSYKFGSRALGLANKNSDIDIFFDTGSSYYGEDRSLRQKDICNFVYQALLDSKECKKIEKVPSARVPIVKFVHNRMNLACDVSFRSGLGHRNTQLLKYFLEKFDWLRPLILVAKDWLRCSKIPPGKRGMTSYTLILMIIFYLQSLDPPLLPSVSYLQGVAIDKVFVEEWDCSIPYEDPSFHQSHQHNCSTQNLLKGFFLFYGSFDFHNLIVCPLLGRPLKRSLFMSTESKDFMDLPPVLSKYLKCSLKNKAPILQIEKPVCVQDPFELSHNVAKGIPTALMVRFQAFCLASHKLIVKWNLRRDYNVCDPPSEFKSRLNCQK